MLPALHSWAVRAARPIRSADFDAIAHEQARFYTILALALCKLINFFGSTWDIQWHVAIGRDSLWIPPHLISAGGFLVGLILSLASVSYETWLDRKGARLPGVVRLGGIAVAPVFLVVASSYLAGIFFVFIDDQWHRHFGLDASLWSPPHLLIGQAMAIIDFSLMLGFAASARRLALKLDWRNLYFWGFVLIGTFMFEGTNFQSSEAFVVSFRYGGAGLLGLLFPTLAGMLYALSLVLALRLAGRYWVALPIFALTLALQYAGTGFAGLGLAILKPVSLIDSYVRLNPQSTIALARQFMNENGLAGLVGLQQAAIMWLSAIPLLLVALLDLWPAARGRWLLAAPVYSLGLVVTCYWLFQYSPVMSKYDVKWTHVVLAAALTAAGGLALGWIGWQLARLVVKNDPA